MSKSYLLYLIFQPAVELIQKTINSINLKRYSLITEEVIDCLQLTQWEGNA
ncbi:MAG: hypothetical protein IPI74_11705 [Bacteroidales bacterium]|nr:hypothetical protein [Bacteroidales bacterium]